MLQCSGHLRIRTKDLLKGWCLRGMPFDSCCLCSEGLVLAMLFWLVAAYALLVGSCLCSERLVQLSLKGWCLLMLLRMLLRVGWWPPYQKLLSSANLNNHLLGGAAAI